MESALVRSECESVSVSAGSCVTRLIYLTTRTAQGCPPPPTHPSPPSTFRCPSGAALVVLSRAGAHAFVHSRQLSPRYHRHVAPPPVEVAGYKSSLVQERQLSFGKEGAIFSESLRHYGGGGF